MPGALRDRLGRAAGRFRRPLPGADRLVLLGIGLIGLRFANWSWLSSLVPGRAAFLANFAIQVLAYALFVLLTALACRSPLPDWVRRRRPGRLLVLAPLGLLLLLVLVSTSIGGALTSDRLQIDDANAMAVCGARAISSGHDPYKVSELECLDQLRISPLLATPLRVGRLAQVQGYPTSEEIAAAVRTAHAEGDPNRFFSSLGKPPLDPVAVLPVARAPGPARALWTLAGMALLAVLLGLAAGPLWIAALTFLLATYFIPGSALNFASFGNAESFAYLLMALAVLWIRRPLLSGICLGLAMGSNELATFFLPAYFLICRGWRQLPSRALGIVLAIGLGVVPWLAIYPDAIGTVWHNLAGPTFPLGYGPIELSLGGVVADPPSWALELATAAAMVLIVIWGWRRPPWRVAAGVLLLSAFWLSWRSLDEYMAQVPLLALAAIVAVLAAEDRAAEAEVGPGPEGAGTLGGA